MMPFALTIRTLLISIVLLVTVTGCRQDTQPNHDASSLNHDSTQETVEPDDARALLRLGLAELENKQWTASETALANLATRLPRNRAALRNLAILRTLFVTDVTSPLRPSGTPAQQEAHRSAIDLARKSISNYRTQITAEADHLLADLLNGKLLVNADAPDQPTLEKGLQQLKQIADEHPDRADLWMASAMAMDRRSRTTQSPEQLDAFHRAFELAPQNLYALQRLLQQQALSLQSENSAVRQHAQATVPDTLQSAAELLAPFQDSVLRYNRIDLAELIDKALENPDTEATNLIAPAMSVANAIKSEIAVQIDRRRLDRDLLTYVVSRFDDPTLITPAATTEESSVLTGFDSRTILPDLAGVTDVAVSDMTLNGIAELVVIQDGCCNVYERSGPTSSEWKLTATAPAEQEEWQSLLLADIDRDFDRTAGGHTSVSILEDRDGDRRIGPPSEASAHRRFDTDLDVIVWNSEQIGILRNVVGEDGTRKLEAVQTIDMDGVNDVVAADVEGDGDLDIVAATQRGIWILTNTNGTQFEISQASDVPVTTMSIGDVDRSIAMDVVGISESSGTGLLQNLFHKRFRWIDSPTVFGPSTPGHCLALLDSDSNLSWDIVSGGASGIVLQRTQTSAPGVITPLDSVAISDLPITDMAIGDLDNDGRQDIAALTKSGCQIFRGNADGSFSRLDLDVPLTTGNSITVTDFDDDGDLDLLLIDSAEHLQLLDNRDGNLNRWMKLVVRGKEDDDQFRSLRVNMHGTGTVIEAVAGAQWQTQIVTEPVVHLGFGQADRLEGVRLVWPNGVPQNITAQDDLPAQAVILAPQILKGSCPYIYTWSGKQFEFFSDCLWSSPIGLVQANGDLAPTREWENLLIPGEQLVPRNDEYVLQITEELWEIAYFDQVELTAIDHPADVQIFTNEKVGPPSLAEHRIHTVRNAQIPRSVTDGRGNQLLPQVTHQDGSFVQAFQGRRLQGLTDEWTLEIDPGSISADGDIRLFLVGWIFPTDTSINLQIEQNPDLDPPAPPVIEVPDQNETWKTVRPFIGFPSGKTKAMVVDLTGLLSDDDSRFRLRSTMELYFDQIFLTVGETDVKTVSQTCSLNSGDLHHRGFSHRDYTGSVFRDGHGPEGYDYSQVDKDTRWPAIAGRFTRYGAAAELVRQHDDRLAVLGPGDELTLRFNVPDIPVPDGWKRDFVLRNVGWDKDADLNTVYGQSSEPYPFRAMTAYPFADADTAPTTPEYQNYLGTFQTREYSPHTFWRELRQLPERSTVGTHQTQ